MRLLLLRFLVRDSEVSNICFNPFQPGITIVIFIRYKARIALAILDL